MKKIIKIILLMLILPGILLMSSCGEEKEQVDIYASIYPVYYLTTNIVKDKLNVEQVYPNGVDVHEYDPVSDGDMKSLVEMSDAKLMFYICENLEAFIEDAKTSIFANSELNIVELGKDLVFYDSITEELETTENGKHSVTADVHIWLDPTYMISMAKRITEEVIKIDNDNKDYYQENYEALLEKLKDLDNTYQEELNKFTFKTMLIDHDAYLYLAKRYGITRIKTRIDNESCDISPNKMIESIDKAKELNIKYIVATKNETVCASVYTIQSEIGAEVVYLDPASTLTQTTENKDYIELMKENLEVLKKIFR